MSKSNIVNNAPFSEETLSSKRQLMNIEKGRRYEPMYPEKDVKEFIQNIKQELSSIGDINDCGDVDSHMIYIGDIHDLLDKLAGEKLS